MGDKNTKAEIIRNTVPWGQACRDDFEVKAPAITVTIAFWSPKAVVFRLIGYFALET